MKGIKGNKTSGRAQKGGFQFLARLKAVSRSTCILGRLIKES